MTMFFLGQSPVDRGDFILPSNVPIVKRATDTVIGHPKKPIYVPLTTFADQVREELAQTNQQYDPGWQMADEYWTEIVNEYPYGLTDPMPPMGYRNNYGLWGGLGAVPQRPKKAKMPGVPNIVQATESEPLKASTIFAVVGGSVVAIGAAVAIWVYFSGKRK
jgi:hypothetical protein